VVASSYIDNPQTKHNSSLRKIKIKTTKLNKNYFNYKSKSQKPYTKTYEPKSDELHQKEICRENQKEKDL
jgi:hypothetical protein